jgi:hypothetical protein
VGICAVLLVIAPPFALFENEQVFTKILPESE